MVYRSRSTTPALVSFSRILTSADDEAWWTALRGRDHHFVRSVFALLAQLPRCGHPEVNVHRRPTYSPVEGRSVGTSQGRTNGKRSPATFAPSWGGPLPNVFLGVRKAAILVRVVHPPDIVASRLLIRIPAVIKPKIVTANSDNQPQYCVGCRRTRMK